MKNRKRNRLKGFDYSSDNLYFVTICVQNMQCYFGEIPVSLATQPNNKIILNPNGLIVQNKLEWLERQYPYVQLHNFIVMPNHVHAIIEIDRIKVKDYTIKIKSLSSLIGAFKTTSSKEIHSSGFLEFAWHRSFHDHIIRRQESYDNISKYIDENPQKWQQDRFYRIS